MRAKERRHDLAFRRHPGRKLAAIYIGGVAGALIRVALAEAAALYCAATLTLGYLAVLLGHWLASL
jgi:fluoride ion exporter CrcB/FEX